MDTSESPGDLTTSDLMDDEILMTDDLDVEVAGGGRPPQLYETDDPLGPDTEPTMVASTGFGGDAAVSAEEAAIRVEEEPEGMNYDEDPGYLD